MWKLSFKQYLVKHGQTFFIKNQTINIQVTRTSPMLVRLIYLKMKNVEEIIQTKEVPYIYDWSSQAGNCSHEWLKINIQIVCICSVFVQIRNERTTDHIAHQRNCVNQKTELSIKTMLSHNVYWREKNSPFWQSSGPYLFKVENL